MPSSLRARRESAASGPNTAVLAGAGGSGKGPLFGRLFGLFRSKPSVQTVADPNANALLAFPSEAALRSEPAPFADVATEPAPRPGSSAPPGPRLVRPLLIVVGTIVLASLTILAIRRFPLPKFTASEPRVGNLTIDTRPVASEVLIDGEQRGMTPLKLSLSPGAHTITVRTGSDERVVPLTIAAGADVTQYFEMKAVEPAALVGRVSV